MHSVLKPKQMYTHAPMIDLQPRWYPYIEHADVYGCHKGRGGDHDHPRSPPIRYDDADAVDDDLQQELNLYTPEEEDGEVKSEAFMWLL
jgi:hypothetical protein